MKIADYYQIIVDTLLTKSGDKYMHRRFQTYSDAFTILIDFVREGIVKPENIDNLILKELCTMYHEAMFSFAITDETLSEWVKDIVARFCIQIPTEESLGSAILHIDIDELAEKLYQYGPGIRTMDKLQTLENLANALSTPESIKRYYKMMKDE